MRCRECNKGLDKGSKNGVCFTCQFWLGKLIIKNQPYTVRVEGDHYMIGAENETSGMRGFGGRKKQ